MHCIGPCTAGQVIPPLDSMSDGWYKEMMFAELNPPIAFSAL